MEKGSNRLLAYKLATTVYHIDLIKILNYTNTFAISHIENAFRAIATVYKKP